VITLFACFSLFFHRPSRGAAGASTNNALWFATNLHHLRHGHNRFLHSSSKSWTLYLWKWTLVRTFALRLPLPLSTFLAASLALEAVVCFDGVKTKKTKKRAWEFSKNFQKKKKNRGACGKRTRRLGKERGGECARRCARPRTDRDRWPIRSHRSRQGSSPASATTTDSSGACCFIMEVDSDPLSHEPALFHLGWQGLGFGGCGGGVHGVRPSPSVCWVPFRHGPKFSSAISALQVLLLRAPLRFSLGMGAKGTGDTLRLLRADTRCLEGWRTRQQTREFLSTGHNKTHVPGCS